MAQAGPHFDSILKANAVDGLVEFLDVVTLSALAVTSSAIRVVVERMSGPIVRAAALARFPVLRAQLPYLHANADFKEIYARHASMQSEVERRHLQLQLASFMTLDHYVFVCQIRWREASTTKSQAYQLMMADKSGPACLVVEGLDPRLVAHLRRSVVLDLPIPHVLLTCLNKSTCKQAVLYESADVFDVSDVYYGEEFSIVYECGAVPRRRSGLEAHLDSTGKGHDRTVVVAARMQLQPDNASRLDFRFEIASSVTIDSLPLDCFLAMLEHDVLFM